MVLGKASLFLFFIIGTSMLPSGSSSTRAYWKNSPDLINDGLKALANHYEDQAPRSPGHINYASITNQLGNDFDDTHRWRCQPRIKYCPETQ
nr:BV-like protein [Cotesia vestalis bracovirus]